MVLKVEVDMRWMYLPCGGIAEYDGDYSYRCHHCMAVVGSTGQPTGCRDEAKKYEAWEAIGGKGWDYEKGEPHAVD